MKTFPGLFYFTLGGLLRVLVCCLEYSLPLPLLTLPFLYSFLTRTLLCLFLFLTFSLLRLSLYLALSLYLTVAFLFLILYFSLRLPFAFPLPFSMPVPYLCLRLCLCYSVPSLCLTLPEPYLMLKVNLRKTPSGTAG